MKSKRKKLSDLDWFKHCGYMAIADTMFHKRLGIVLSHQPYINENITRDYHRMADENGKIHYVHTDDLYTVTSEESDYYWSRFNKYCEDKYFAERVYPSLISRVFNRVWYLFAYMGIYQLNWAIKRKLGDERMHDSEMWKLIRYKIKSYIENT